MVIKNFGLEMRGMASKMWRFGKKVTLWGAAVSSLPILFPILLFISALGFALAVPLGFVAVSYMCLRKMFAVVIHKNVINGKGMFGLKSPESETTVKSKLEGPPNEVVDAGFRAEIENNETLESPYESQGHSIEEIDQTITRAKEEEQKRPQSEQYLEGGTHYGDNDHEDTHEEKTDEVKHLEEISLEGKTHKGESHQEISYEGKTYDEKSHEENTHRVETHEETLCEGEIHDLKFHECENQLKHEDPHAMPMEKLIALDTKHKREEEEEKSTEMQEIPSNRSCVVEPQEFASQQSTLGEEMKTGEGKIVTPRSAYFSAQQDSQAESPCSTDRPSSLKSEYDSIAGECADEMLEITLMPSLEMHVSSESEDDQHSNFSEQDSDDEENVWEEIDAVRKIVGYKGAPNASYIDEIGALYVFMGVEPPASLKNSFNLIEARQKLEFLKSVVGVK